MLDASQPLRLGTVDSTVALCLGAIININSTKCGKKKSGPEQTTKRTLVYSMTAGTGRQRVASVNVIGHLKSATDCKGPPSIDCKVYK